MATSVLSFEQQAHRVAQIRGFEKSTIGSHIIYLKTYPSVDSPLRIDFLNKRFDYPEGIKIHRETTCNFSAPENLVVFECVEALLSMGYKPWQLVLEKGVPGGHKDAGGYCDITVQDNEGVPYIIIECKTTTGEENDEFQKAWSDTRRNGSQLFNYFNSNRQAKFLCLYASRLQDNEILRDYRLISMQDNDDYLKANKSLKGYKHVTQEGGTRDDYFRVWRETYQSDYLTSGLFEDGVQPFEIHEQKRTIDNLITPPDTNYIKSKYNDFATILRKHNVSSHENAFDKLVNLFLVKAVDESRNQDNLKFLWKGAAYDDDYSFQDRLQELYQIGMKEYLGEEVTYIKDEQVEQAFRMQKNDPDAIKDTILQFFRQLKFYSNSDFGFLDVHNEQLFRQNAVILKEVVLMLQDLRIRTEEPNQFLGDLFEGYLDQGVKQNEGQFFTPLPITRFMISALPLEQIIRDNTEIPHAIDFACGAGHFLNEYAAQIKPYVLKYKNKDELKQYFEQIYGIEKEYRLSKVSKVSSFMYGQEGLQIVYGDALTDHSDKGVKDNSFHVLIANPPYSVSGFLGTLTKEERERYTLSQYVDDKAIDTNNSIETFFIERAKQLMTAGGVAAIILPISVLTNGKGVYVHAREIFLRYFDIVGISEFGGATFGKTNTNTVVFFLRRKRNNPDLAEHLEIRINDWFADNHTQDKRYQDFEQLQAYCNHVGLNYNDYLTLLQGHPNAALLQTELFQSYAKAFAQSATAKNILKKKITAKYSQDDKDIELLQAKSKFMVDIEKDKLLYFLLAENNLTADNRQCMVLVTKMPSDTKAAKAFLGYEWSERKGNEGIKYTGAQVADDDDISCNKGIAQIKTPLFNPANLFDENKLNSLIRANFNGTLQSIPQDLQPFASLHRLTDMLDFSKATFDKAIKTNIIKQIEITSKYPLVKLCECVSIVRGVSFDKLNQTTEETNNVVLTADNITLDGRFVISKKIYVSNAIHFDKEKMLRANDCFMCFSSGSKQHIGKVAFINSEEPYYAGGFMGILRTFSPDIKPKYLYDVLNAENIREIIRSKSNGTNIQNLSSQIGEVKIPLPPIEIQQQIIDECAKVDEEYNTSRMTIEDYKSRISSVFADLQIDTKIKLNTCLQKIVGVTSKVPTDHIFASGDYPVITQEENSFIVGYTSNIAPIMDVPLIVFGDHSCTFKYVDFPFVRGADGTQLLKPDKSIDTKFLYYYLQQVKIKNADRYERHYKYLKDILIPVIDIEQQHKIVAQIEEYEKAIAAARSMMDSCTARKAQILQKYL